MLDAIRITRYVPESAAETAGLIAMYEAYLREELDRTHDFADGYPAAAYLNTFLVHDGAALIGFCSIDTVHRAIELIYITPEFRRRGIASNLVKMLKASCPAPMRAKAPLSPLGQLLMDATAVPATDPPPEDVRRGEEERRILHRALSEACQHRRGNPGRACGRCQRACVAQMAKRMVLSYVLLKRLDQRVATDQVREAA
ncbi:GNAT family N-acetyltransferase [Kitasatospora terrestris]|uniref:N-acetyltransferase domain-containing protein n=1 Tax=Kitasatospora terrestris TaxID=258051 RepID=A0ABP9E4V7_9ACTN